MNFERLNRCLNGLDLQFGSVKQTATSLLRIGLLLLEAYAVFWVVTRFDWQPVLPVYQWY